MTLDPRIAAMQAAAAQLPSLPEIPLAEARSRSRSGNRPPVIEVARVQPLTVAADGREIPCRLYENGPADATVVYAHGGGWALGDLDTGDDFCRALAAAGPVRVISVDYRLSPEHPYPAGLDDVRRAVDWALERAPRGGVVLAGDSAGGNLAAVVAREFGARLRGLSLFYPVLDLAFALPSVDDPDAARPLGRPELEWFRSLYTADADPGSPELSPLRHPVPAQHPPVYLLTAQHCPLRDEGAAYAAALIAHGVPVVHEHADTMCHGFLRLADVVPAAGEWRERAVARTLALLRRAG